MEGDLPCSGLGSGSSGRRLPRAHVREPRCARSSWQSWKEGARASLVVGGQPAPPRSGGQAAGAPEGAGLLACAQRRGVRRALSLCKEPE